MSKSEEKRVEALKGEAPAWKENSQKQTGAKKPESKKDSKPKRVKVKMKTNYRDVAKTGDVYETDADKAAELVRLGRAEYVK